MVQSHTPFPHASALFVSLVEFVCGGGLALGLLTPLCALMLVGAMIVAVATNPEVLYVMILVWLIFAGPGRYSIDGLIARRAAVVGVDRKP